ncbi:hypothetical protein JHK82_022544 [Glycine max]|uniref:Uncharacterized protein n=2 Tax=Glycine subgen. Soja TaxID=1462606 RepID=K7L8Z4_SOYBN|nr:hypothetical protein JHK87_022452 [Glycine soja]KAG5026647.1 hypothetical protein JHK86_022561 [Glycine max]KAG5137813.1 hypothetical protein JHK82_022544 [Glycine max]KAH1053158.1 hypothetical protein GYH30_022454 [Glycine max]RZB98909.1 hypothetical protein D0Y65_021685 [Glycine soja]
MVDLIPNPKCYKTKYSTTTHWQLLIKKHGSFPYRFLCPFQSLPLVPPISTKIPEYENHCSLLWVATYTTNT